MLVIPDGTMFYTWQKKNEFTEITIISFDLCNFEGTNPQMDDSCMFKCILWSSMVFIKIQFILNFTFIN